MGNTSLTQSERDFREWEDNRTNLITRTKDEIKRQNLIRRNAEGHVHHNYIKHVHSQVVVDGEGSPLGLPHLYYEGDESNIKILIEKIQIK